MQDALDDRNGSIINRNQRNQSMSTTTQAREHVEQSFVNTDYTDYGDGVINRNQCNQSQSALSQASMRDYDVNCVINRNQYMPAITQVSNDVGQSSPTWIDYADYDDGVINRNHRNQSNLQHSQATLRFEQSENDSALHTNDSSPGKARASPNAQQEALSPSSTCTMDPL